MRFVFVMDPVATIKVDEDTTFALMLEAQAQGHRIDHCIAEDVYLSGRKLSARVRPAKAQRDPKEPLTLSEMEDVCLDDVDAIFVRRDPPFDQNYLWLTLMLEHVRDRVLVLNDPRGIRDANEKLYACHFPEVMPETLVSSHKERIRQFVRDVGGKAVIKPVDGHGGEGVFALSVGDGNENALIETVTGHGRRVAMTQRFLPEVTKGDKRILLIDGEPLGAILRVPQGGDVRSNIHAGGTVEKAELDADDRRIVDAVADRLRRDGLFFVGLDVIGGKLTEVNVTSPTGIQQMSRLMNTNLSARVIDWVEARIEKTR